MEALENTEPSRDREAVVATALDYFEGWFDGDEARMERALHPDLAKRRAGDELGTTLTRQGEGRKDAADRRLEVEVTGLYADIASATVRSAICHEYLHLVRTREGWKIANALWQRA